MHTVPLSAEDFRDYYEGFANATLWPLYHDAVEQPEFHRRWWEAYQRVNQRFAEAAAETAEPGGLVWVQDYHLQLVPGLLRELRPGPADRLLPARAVPAAGAVHAVAAPGRAAARHARRRPDRLPAGPGRAQLRPARHQGARPARDRPADRRRRPGGAHRRLPGLHRHRRDGRAGGAPGGRRTGPPAPARPRPAGAGDPQRRPDGLHEGHRAAAQGVPRTARQRRHQGPRHRAGAGGGAQPRPGGAVPDPAGPGRAPGRADQRRVRPGRRAGDPLPLPAVRPGRAGRALPRRGRDGGDAAARRDEPGGEGVRGGPGRRHRRAAAQRVRRRRLRAGAGVPGQPARPRRPQAGAAGRAARRPGGRGGPDAAPCANTWRATTSTPGRRPT